MDTLRPADLAARVVAWHNRHPLARRITREQVVGIGVVGLPFALRLADPDGAEPAGTPGSALTPIFDTHWMYGADAARLHAFAARQGRYPLDAAAHWPWRHIDASLALAHAADAAGLAGRTARHLLSAVIEADGRRSRVLVAPTRPLSQAPVFGRRLYSLPRLVAGVGGGAAAASAVAAGLLFGPIFGSMPAASAVQPLAATGGPAPAASHGVVVVASAAEAASAPPAASAIAPEPASETTTAEAPSVDPAPPAHRPIDVAPMLQDAQAAGPLVRIRPTLTEDERRQARLQAEALRPDPAAALVKATAYALATPPLRTRDDAKAQQVLLHSMKAQVATPVPTQLDVMPAGRRWRVVWWPHPAQDEAERLRLEARARGLRLEVIAF